MSKRDQGGLLDAFRSAIQEIPQHKEPPIITQALIQYIREARPAIGSVWDITYTNQLIYLAGYDRVLETLERLYMNQQRRVAALAEED